MRRYLLLLLCLPNVLWAEERIVIASYYTAPPFVTGSGQGLTYDFAKLLNRHLGPEYQFAVQLMPRKRVDRLLQADGWRGFVPWVNVSWMDDGRNKLFAWTPILLWDQDLLISHSQAPIEWQGPASLQNRVFGGVIGHRYDDIEPLIVNGQIRRDDAPNEWSNLQKLQKRRIDATFIAQSSWRYYLRQYPELLGELNVSSHVRKKFSMHLVTPKPNQSLIDNIFNTLRSGRAHKDWQVLARRYGFDAERQQ